mmetsp:Transcript_4010/g.7356  ORF Transcript_4010/g.7356 Transcript_4010/m.7356 type:complete len:209 (+) Transcript_4010:146-772(+)|eukprot:CAMPEP_0197516434 /NCGR_PEP_ID=MMETSP1318-20131121/1321_1 /TAXON_ID=552666 /ORGANISM="Partenskyella glossopodia, Strain RCC365" /LENGTH=208 /DNA_ID=CAMNT_0043065183 /DNA_START=133 /DNA_END=759 /DNA_ORIENTATION=+
MFSVSEFLLHVAIAATAYLGILSLFVAPFKSTRAVSDFSGTDTATVASDSRANSTNGNPSFLVLGDRKSGKTAFINNFKGGKVNFKEVSAADPSQITTDAYQSAKAAIVICDSTNPDLGSAGDWFELVKLGFPGGIPVFLVATRMDLIADDVQGRKLGATMCRISKKVGFHNWFVLSSRDKDAVKGVVDYVLSDPEQQEAIECKFNNM